MAARPAIPPLRVLSLFSGIGGLDLGVHRAAPGSRTVLYLENGLYPAAVLAARMADGRLDAAPVWSDIRTFDAVPWRGAVDLIIGGFPCQDISIAGRRAGITPDTRSGLWFEFARIIRQVEPRYVFLENVAAIVTLGLDIVLGDLAALGFAAEWGCLAATDVGAPHRRERWFLLGRREGAGAGLADPDNQRRVEWWAAQHEPDGRPETVAGVDLVDGDGADAGGTAEEQLRQVGVGQADPDPEGRGEPQPGVWEGRSASVGGSGDVAHPRQSGLAGGERGGPPGARHRPEAFGSTAELCATRPEWPPRPDDHAGWAAVLERWPALEPAVRGVAARSTSRVDRLAALGNAVVPAQAALAFRLLWDRLHADE